MLFDECCRFYRAVKRPRWHYREIHFLETNIRVPYRCLRQSRRQVARYYNESVPYITLSKAARARLTRCVDRRFATVRVFEFSSESKPKSLIQLNILEPRRSFRALVTCQNTEIHFSPPLLPSSNSPLPILHLTIMNLTIIKIPRVSSNRLFQLSNLAWWKKQNEENKKKKKSSVLSQRSKDPFRSSRAEQRQIDETFLETKEAHGISATSSRIVAWRGRSACIDLGAKRRSGRAERNLSLAEARKRQHAVACACGVPVATAFWHENKTF